MIKFKEIKYKNYKTVTYKGIDINVSPELLQDISAGTQKFSLLEELVLLEYERLLPIIRNKKIKQLLK